MPDELVGTAEIAQMLGVVRQYVHRLSQEDSTFPKPVAELAAGRVWKRGDIVNWAKATGRKVGKDA
jgi:predicted DNA-binding transcriptional regulator AlpA